MIFGSLAVRCISCRSDQWLQMRDSTREFAGWHGMEEWMFGGRFWCEASLFRWLDGDFFWWIVGLVS